MAKPFREGAAWSVRPCYRGVRTYLSGFKTSAEARAAAEKMLVEMRQNGAPAFGGAGALTLAQALRTYAQEVVAFHKGARQELQRINKYLLASNMNPLRCAARIDDDAGPGAIDDSPRALFLLDTQREPALPPASLRKHRRTQSANSERSDRLRAQIARTPVAQISRHAIQKLFNALQNDGYKPATLDLERSLLRAFFNYARKTWAWHECERNPASELRLPVVDNMRTRVMSDAEESRLIEMLGRSRNQALGPIVLLLVETAMRISEPLVQSKWSDVDLDAGILTLWDAKAGARRVPLSPRAVAVLSSLPRRDGDNRLFDTTYEAVRAAWNRLCKRAGVEGLNIHDLRRTAATRYYVATGGNTRFVKILTGHKTDKMLDRYVVVDAKDVVEEMRTREKIGHAKRIAEGA